MTYPDYFDSKKTLNLFGLKNNFISIHTWLIYMLHIRKTRIFTLDRKTTIKFIFLFFMLEKKIYRDTISHV